MAGTATAQQPISEAEQQLLLTDHLQALGAVSTLRYTFTRTGGMEHTISDHVRVTLGTQHNAGGRRVDVQFLTAERALDLPPVENAKGNPVILAFLERDVREMQRLTKGQANYFRKRVRLALAEDARLEDTLIELDGVKLPAQRITFSPYTNDPLRPRFERLANKIYDFVLCERVPGWVYEMRTTVKNAADAALVEEVLRFEGADP